MPGEGVPPRGEYYVVHTTWSVLRVGENFHLWARATTDKALTKYPQSTHKVETQDFTTDEQVEAELVHLPAVNFLSHGADE